MSRLSRQRQIQLANTAAGLCQQCSRPSPEKVLCDRCAAARQPFSKRHLPKSTWWSVDWSLSNAEIAKQLGVNPCTVGNNRRKFGHPRPGRRTVGEAMGLLRDIARSDEGALLELGRSGIDIPPSSKVLVNRVREFLWLPPL